MSRHERLDQFVTDHVDKVSIGAVTIVWSIAAVLVFTGYLWLGLLEFGLGFLNIAMMRRRYANMALLDRTLAMIRRCEELTTLGMDHNEAHRAAMSEYFGIHDDA